MTAMRSFIMGTKQVSGAWESRGGGAIHDSYKEYQYRNRIGERYMRGRGRGSLRQ